MRPGHMRILKKLTLIFTLVLIAGAGWAAVYAYDKGFTKKWRRLVNTEFEKRGIEASIGKLTLDPFQGLVARDVMFYQDKNRRKLLAAVSRIILDVDFIRLLEKDFFLNTIDIRKANVSLPIDPEDPRSDRLVIRNFDARILMPDDRVEISQATGNLHGVRVAVHGYLYKPRPVVREPGDTSPEESPEQKAANQLEIVKERRHLLHRAVVELDKLEFPEETPPTIDIELAGDLDDPANLRGTARITATDLKRGNFLCRELDARIELARTRLAVKEFTMKDEKGVLRAQCEYQWGSDTIPLKLESDLDIHALFGSFVNNQSLGEIVFYDAPKLKMEADVLLRPAPDRPGRLPIRAVGSFESDTFASHGVIFDGFKVDFGIREDRYYFRNIRLSHSTGSFAANAIYGPGGIEYEADLRMDPSVFATFAKTEGTRKFLGKVDLDEESSLYFRAKGSGPSFDMSTWHSFAEIDVRDFEFNGVPIKRFETDAEINRRDRRYTKIKITRDEGSATVDRLDYNMESKISRIHGARGRLHPPEIARCFSAGIADHLTRYRFTSPPAISLAGTIDPKGKKATDLVVKVSADNPVGYDFLGKPLSIENSEANLHFKGDSLSTAHIQGNLFGGKLNTDFSIDNLSSRNNYVAKVDVKSVAFHDLAALYGYHEETEGELTGYFNFTGEGNERANIDGKGVGIIVNGDVFAIPVLGPLSKLISGVVSKSGAGHSIAREASANITMKDGIIATDDFEALAPGFRLLGSGTIDCENDSIDFDARLNARGAPGLILLPVSKLFEYTCAGSISNPVWKPKVLAGANPAARGDTPGGNRTPPVQNAASRKRP